MASDCLNQRRIYVRSLLPLVQEGRVKGLAHITGGGLLENVPRILPENCHAMIEANRWQLPELFTLFQKAGRIAPAELARTFNCGVGMVVIVASRQVEDVTRISRRCWRNRV